MHTNSALPLAGVRILDLSRVLAGPLCSMMLADLGADIIKVERTIGGDETRGWGPPFASDGQSAYFLSVNRNKLSLGADFSQGADVELLLELAATADVVLENFLPDVLRPYGIDRDALLAANPNLIWCTISGFGPHSSRPGYDFVVQAESGWMAITGPVAGSPHKIGVALVDVITGKDAAIAILAALVGRGRASALERALHVSLQGSAAASLVNVAQNALVSGQPSRRWGNAHPNLVPYELFEASDAPLVITVGSDSQWRSLVSVLQLPELGRDEALNTNAGRLAERARVITALSRELRKQTAGEWVTQLEAAGVPCGRVRSVLDALRDVTASAETGIAPAAGGTVRLSPPRLNEHGEIIRRMHWSAFKEVPILG